MKIVKDAMSWNTLQSQATSSAPRIREHARKATVVRPGVTLPGKTRGQARAEVVHRADANLKKSGSVDDFAKALMARQQARNASG